MSNPRSAGRLLRREWLMPAVGISVALLVMGFSVTVLSIAHASGVVYWASEPVVLAAQTIAVLTAVGTGVLLQLRQVRGPGHAIVAMGYVLAAYPAFQAVSYALVFWAGATGPVVEFIVGLGLSWWVIVLSVGQLAALAVGHYIRGVRRYRYQTFQIVYLTVVMALFIPQSIYGYPFEHVPVFLGDSLGQVAALHALAPFLSYGWMAMLPIVPILLLWSVRNAAPQDRRPLVITAVASVMPVAIVLICQILWLAFTPAGMPESVAEIVLIASHGLGIGFAAFTLGFALRHAHRRTAASDRAVAMFVSVGATILLLIVAVSTSIGLSLAIGGGAVFVVAIITAVLAIGFMSARQRIVDAVIAQVDPYRARARKVLANDDPLSRPHPRLAALAAVQQSLRDPEADLLLALPDGRWVDVEGRPAEPDGAVRYPESGEPLAAVRSTADAEAVRTVASELREVLERAELAASIEDQAARLVEEQQRSALAAATERQRLERNLHDGVQGRLLALALQLRQAESEDPNARLVFGEAVESLRSAIDELRTLATGSMPTTLVAGGLRAALGDVCSRMPLPVDLDVTGSRFRPELEEVAYFVVNESLTNAVKHGHADTIGVRVRDGRGRLEIEVVDDGRGGADPRSGSGLRGLGERVRAAGGQLLVSELHPHGTRVEVSLPCD